VNLVVCDDHRLLAECLAGLLAARGHRVVATVHHPDDAVRIIAGDGDDIDGHDIDVCVMDLTFAGATAFGAIGAICASSPTTKVVVLSGSAQPFAEVRAFEAGAAAFVLKDDDVSRVIDVVERLAHHDGSRTAESSRAVDDAPPPLEPFGGIRLTVREREVLQRLVSGERTHAIAAGMGVSYSTARTHVQNLLHKLGVHSRLEAVAFALRHALVPVGCHPG
jgi:DNA-binding NarL/FixJ family response regulator